MLARLVLIICLCFGFLSITSVQAFAATPQITILTAASETVGRYQKYESTFSISKSFPANSFLPYYFYDPADTPVKYPGRTSPYGVDGITIDAHIKAPSGKELTVPAFYYQQYSGSGHNLVAGATYAWKIRFAPSETGSYSYTISIQDKDGTTTSPVYTFQSVASNSKGFVRVSPRDSRFLEFENGQSFIPNSSGSQWWLDSGKRSDSYAETFTAYKANGINFLRIWDQNDGFGLTVEGPYDAYIYPEGWGLANKDSEAMAIPKGTQMNQRGNYEEDRIIESAEKNDVYIQLCSHGDPYWIWDASVYTEGWNPKPRTMADPEHVNYWKRNFRYRVARWGYSTSVFAWETWNEHGHILAGSDAYAFYQTMGSYESATDPYKHLRTTSQGSQAWSPGLWSSSAFDIANYHDYMMQSRYASLYNDAAQFVYRFAQCFRSNGSACSGLGVGDGSTWSGAAKPYVWGELDSAGSPDWNIPNPQPKSTHDMRWAGLFSPLGTTGIEWYANEQAKISGFVAKKYADAKIVSNFFADIDYAGAQFSYLATSDIRTGSELITPSNSNIRVMAMRAGNKQHAYAYLQNKGAVLYTQTSSSAQSGTIPFTGMNNGTYTIEYWDTSTGAKTTASVTTTSGTVDVPVSNLTSDMAIKVRNSTYTGSSGTPQPTPATNLSSAEACSADIDQAGTADTTGVYTGTVNLSDYTIFARDFLKTALSNPRSDINHKGDGANLTDYTILVRYFLKSVTCQK